MGCLFGEATSVLNSFYCILEIEHVVIGEPHVDLEKERGNERAVEIGIVCVDEVSNACHLLELALHELAVAIC